MALFDRNRFCALASAFMLSAVLTGCGSSGGGGGGGGTPGDMRTFNTGTPTATERTGTARDDVWTIEGDLTGNSPALVINGAIDGLAGADELQLNDGAVVASVAFSDTAPTGGALNLQNIETITLDGGTVNTIINASAAGAGVTFDLRSGTAGGDITGSGQNDVFIISGDITRDSPALDINGLLQGGVGTDEVRLVAGGVVNNLDFASFAEGDLSLRSVETITIDGGIVNSTINAVFGTTTSITFNLMSGTINSSMTDGGGIGGTNHNDTFNLRGTITINGLILGNNGADIFNLEGGTITGDVEGGAGADSFVIGAGITIGGTIDGGADMDTLSLDFTPASAELRSNVLTLTFSGGSLTLTLASIETIDIAGLVALPLTFTATAGADTFAITTDITNPARSPLESVINGGDETDELQLNAGAVVASVAFSNTPPTGGSGVVNLQNIETITLDGGTVNGTIDASAAPLNASPPTEGVSEGVTGVTFDLRSGAVGDDAIAITGSGHNDLFIIAGDIATDTDGDTAGLQAALAINGLVQGGGGTADEVRLDAGGVVSFIDFDSFESGILSVRDVEVITINGGTVNSNVSAVSQTAAVMFNLISGTITDNVFGSDHNDIFNLHAGIMIGGVISGGDGTDVLRYAGAGDDGEFVFTARGGLAQDDDIRGTDGEVRLIESQVDDPTITSLGAGAGGAPASAGASLRGLTVRGIEVLNLSPALNLYGAMSDALMQFGQQTAQGFALADLNLASGRATQLVSKDSPFTKGRIWAHKITHSGNGKGSIGLGLTGLTARADSDYDYEMSLTQHGFDAPLATTRLGAFSLRAVSHTMTGVIETNVAEAQVSGYGAGLALLWNSGAAASKASASATRVSAHHSASAHHHHGLSAHITSLAGAYEVEAHTSPLNPRAVVSEITEGSFSAINAVVSAGVADKREIAYGLSLRTSADITWQTLSLDDFSETGADGIIINFDKATRFTARIGAGLESEHWFSDVVFVHETSSGGTLSSGLSQDYKQDDGTAIEMKLGGKLADLATGLTLKAYAGLRTSLTRSDSIDPSAHLALNWRF